MYTVHYLVVPVLPPHIVRPGDELPLPVPVHQGPQLGDHVLQTLHHRRRICREEKAKVVDASWGTELVQFLAVLAILHQDDLKNGEQISLFINLSWSK